MAKIPAQLEKSILACVSDGVLAFDMECRYIVWNPVMERISGIKAANVVGQNAFQIFPFLKDTEEDKYFYAALEGHSSIARRRHFKVPESGHSGYFEARYSPLIDENGLIFGGVAIVVDVTEHVLAEQKKSEQFAAEWGEKHFRELVDHVPHIIWTSDNQGKNQFTNRFGLEFVGFSEGQNNFERWASAIHPDDFDALSKNWEESFRYNKPYESQHRLRRASDGAFRWFLGRAIPVKNANGETVQWIGASTDVHEYAVASMRAVRLQAMTAAFSSAVTPEQILKIVLAEGLNALGAKNGVIAVYSEDQDSLEIISSQGYSSAVIQEWKWVPMSASIPLTVAAKSKHAVYVESLEIAKEKYPLIVESMKLSEETAFVALPLIIENQLIGVLGVSFSENKVVDEDFDRFMLTLSGLCSQALARARIYESERQARASADSANAAKSSFLASVSHEIRTPLGSIVGYADLLLRPSISPEKRKAFSEGIERNSRALTRLIDDILDLSKIEAGRLSVEILEIDFQVFLKELVESLKDQAHPKGIDFRLVLENNIPDIIYSDALRLRQILLNVCGNAIKFTDSGSVTLTVRFHRHEFGSESLQFLVEDTGIGLHEGEHEILFRPFSQARSVRTRRSGGTGLGLVISRNLARVLGGDVNLISSQPGQGSAFEIRISPFRKATPAAVEKVRDIGPNCLKGKRILVVDDAPDVRVILSDVLTQQGAEVELAENGSEALSQARTTSYDAIVMDLEMPVMNGWEAASQLRATGFKKPIVAITANPMADVQASLRSGFDSHLVKPIDNTKLLHVLVGSSENAQPKK